MKAVECLVSLIADFCNWRILEHRDSLFGGEVEQQGQYVDQRQPSQHPPPWMRSPRDQSVHIRGRRLRRSTRIGEYSGNSYILELILSFTSIVFLGWSGHSPVDKKP